jgi:AraC-like DNA-binding protein
MKSLGLSLHMLHPFAAVIARSGGDGHRFLAEVGVDPSAPRETFVAGAAVDRAVDRLAEERGDPALALTLARTAVTYPFGFFEHLAWTGATVRDAFDRVARFYGIITNRVTVRIEDRDDGVVSFTQHPVRGAARGSKVTEFALALGVLRARQAAGGLMVRAVRFVHPAPPGTESRYRELFAAPVHFGQEVDAVELDAVDLQRTVGTADATAAAALEAEALKILQRTDDFLARVRQSLVGNVKQPTHGLAEVARRMNVSQRTVQRRLGEHETSLRVIADEVRRDQALALLDGGTAIGAAAFALGFAHAPAFHKAFVRWTGMTPGAYLTGRRHGCA